MVRKVLHTLHLWLGLISGSLLALVALTGCVLAFEDEIRSLTQHDVLYVEAEQRPQLNVEQILAVVKQHDPHMKLNQIRYYGEADKAIQVYARDRRKILAVNPYTGAVLGVRDMKKDVMSVILSFHRTLLLEKTGETIIYVNVWIFLFMLVSGLVIWLPRKVKQLRQNFSLKLSAAPKKRNYDLHRMLGFYAWMPLFLIAITGISMASGGEKGPKVKSTYIAGAATGGGIYDRALAEVYHQEPYDMLRVTFPADSAGVINIGIRYQTSSFRKQSTFMFDQYSGALLKTESYQDKSFGQTFFGSSYEIHTGRILGIPGKIVMFLAGLVALSLPVTGFLIWRGKAKRSTVQPPTLETSFGGQSSPR